LLFRSQPAGRGRENERELGSANGQRKGSLCRIEIVVSRASDSRHGRCLSHGDTCSASAAHLFRYRPGCYRRGALSLRVILHFARTAAEHESKKLFILPRFIRSNIQSVSSVHVFLRYVLETFFQPFARVNPLWARLLDIHSNGATGWPGRTQLRRVALVRPGLFSLENHGLASL